MCYGTILSDSLRRAAKSHRCDVCERIIDKGDLHRHSVAKDGRDILTSRICETCAAAVRIDPDDDLTEDGCIAVNGIAPIRAAVRSIGWKAIKSSILKCRERFLRRAT